MMTSPDAPDRIAERENLIQVRDESRTREWVEQAIAENEKAVQDALDNPKKKKKARGFLTGQVMKISGGKADPKMVGQLIEERLSQQSQE